MARGPGHCDPSLGNLDQARGKSYFIYHSPADSICSFGEAQLAERHLREHGAKVKLVTYSGGHGWVPNTYYCDRIREGIEWLKANNSKPDRTPSESLLTPSATPPTPPTPGAPR